MYYFSFNCLVLILSCLTNLSHGREIGRRRVLVRNTHGNVERTVDEIPNVRPIYFLEIITIAYLV